MKTQTHTGVSFPPGLLPIIKEVAAADGRPVSNLLVKLAIEYIKKKHPEHAKKLAGLGKEWAR